MDPDDPSTGAPDLTGLTGLTGTAAPDAGPPFTAAALAEMLRELAPAPDAPALTIDLGVLVLQVRLEHLPPCGYPWGAILVQAALWERLNQELQPASQAGAAGDGFPLRLTLGTQLYLVDMEEARRVAGICAAQISRESLAGMAGRPFLDPWGDPYR